MIRARLLRWIEAPAPSGLQALLCGFAALAVPTLVRWALDGVVSGCEFTPYLPSVLVCAILLRWWQAAGVALGSVVLIGLLFDGSPAQFLVSPCFQSSAGMFFASSAAMIGVAMLVRSAMAALRRRGSDDGSGGIVFSVEKGDVWASWYGSALPVRLGSQQKVAAMMRDFLAQVELGRRLEGRPE